MIHTEPFRRAATLAAAVLFAVSVVAQEAAAEKEAPPRPFAPFTILKESARLPVLSQGSTGTCWSYATASFLESEIKRLRGIDADLSEMWFARIAIIEKARRYVEAGGKAQFGEGGLSHDLTELMGTYGAMPHAAYTGLVDGKKSHAHQEMFAVLTSAVKAMSGEPKEGAASNPARAARPRKPSPAFLRAVAAIVDSYLGVPPETFEVDGKTYDPKSYAKDYLKLEPGDYVQVMSSGASPFGGKAMLDVPDNWLKFDRYENIGVDALMAAMDSALDSGFTIALDCDVSEKGFSHGKAVATVGVAEEKNPALITQEVRDAMFKSGETQDDHLMHVVGVARHDDGRRFYLTKNSWGEKSGPYGGYFFLSEAYMRAKALSFMVHKDALTRKT